jgi:hypothetical protein
LAAIPSLRLFASIKSSFEIMPGSILAFVKQKIVKAATLEKDFDVTRLEGETI